MTDRLLAQIGTPGPESPPRGPSRRSDPRRSDGQASSRRDWLREPKSAVWMALAAIILIGGGRRLHWAWRARKAVARLSEPGVTPEEIEAVADSGGRASGSCSGSSAPPSRSRSRTAAGRALARLWKRRRARRRGGAGAGPSRLRGDLEGAATLPTLPHRRHPDRRPVTTSRSCPTIRRLRPRRRPGMVPPDRRRPSRRPSRSSRPGRPAAARSTFSDHPRRFPHQRPAPPGLADQGPDVGPLRRLGDRATPRPVPVRFRPGPEARCHPDPLRRGPGRGDGAGHPPRVRDRRGR